MKVVIDTSSLLSLVRYYLPFDEHNLLADYFKEEIQQGRLLLTDAVLQECRYTAGGLVLKSLTYLNEKEFRKQYGVPVKTKNLLPPARQRFYNMVDNNFVTGYARAKLTAAEFEQAKREYLDSADGRIIIYALVQKHKYPDQPIVIVTEETEAANDNKAFKKIPAICRLLGIPVLTLPDLLKGYQGIEINFQ